MGGGHRRSKGEHRLQTLGMDGAERGRQAPPLPSDADWSEVGIDDPRILWKSEPLPNGAILGRAYDYATTSVGRLSGMRVTVGSTLFAGSQVKFEGSQRKSEQLLGISGGQRFDTFGYDDQGRVTGKVTAGIDPNAIPQLGIPGASTVTLSDADFRSELNRTVPASTITGQSAKGHKVATVTEGTATETLLYKGADGLEVSVRTDDARYHYDFDEKEHLRAITERLIPTRFIGRRKERDDLDNRHWSDSIAMARIRRDQRICPRSCAERRRLADSGAEPADFHDSRRSFVDRPVRDAIVEEGGR
jgi:hypothetical protein